LRANLVFFLPLIEYSPTSTVQRSRLALIAPVEFVAFAVLMQKKKKPEPRIDSLSPPTLMPSNEYAKRSGANLICRLQGARPLGSPEALSSKSQNGLLTVHSRHSSNNRAAKQKKGEGGTHEGAAGLGDACKQAAVSAMTEDRGRPLQKNKGLGARRSIRRTRPSGSGFKIHSRTQRPESTPSDRASKARADGPNSQLPRP